MILEQDAIAVLRALLTAKHINLGDLIYTVREHEGAGWDGPAVKAWSDAVVAAEKLLVRADKSVGGPSGHLPDHTERHFDAIDAGFFSGDTFHTVEALQRFEWYIARWQNEAQRIRALSEPS